MFPLLSSIQACRSVNDSGVCKHSCPPPTFYDPATFQSKVNPDKKFSFGATCVKTCPCENLLSKHPVYLRNLQHGAQLMIHRLQQGALMMVDDEREKFLIHFSCQNFPTRYRDSNLAMLQSDQIPSLYAFRLPAFHFIIPNLFSFLFARKMHFKHFVSLSVDNYLAMHVACTLVCPKANQEVIVSPPDGDETQKCETCEGDCPKGGDHCVYMGVCGCMCI